jgi:hypothetical protein
MIPSLQRVAVGIADMPVASGQASLNVFGEKLVVHLVPARSSNIWRLNGPPKTNRIEYNVQRSTKRDDIKKGKSHVRLCHFQGKPGYTRRLGKT